MKRRKDRETRQNLESGGSAARRPNQSGKSHITVVSILPRKQAAALPLGVSDPSHPLLPLQAQPLTEDAFMSYFSTFH